MLVLRNQGYTPNRAALCIIYDNFDTEMKGCSYVPFYGKIEGYNKTVTSHRLRLLEPSPISDISLCQTTILNTLHISKSWSLLRIFSFLYRGFLNNLKDNF